MKLESPGAFEAPPESSSPKSSTEETRTPPEDSVSSPGQRQQTFTDRWLESEEV